MDLDRFDDLTRLLGSAGTRRAGLRAALGAIGILGVAAVGPNAEAKRRRKKCSPPCAVGQTCVKGACTCADGGTVCGATCCRIGQECRDGQCTTMPDPGSCVAFGEPCKGVGRPCCDTLACGSGQGGGPVACWVRKTGRCASTAECVFGTQCEDGICVGPPDPIPAPTCDPEACPPCGTTPAVAAGLERVCIDGACGCACKQVSGTWSGVNCTSTGGSCIPAGFCTDMSGTIDTACNGAALCCCQLV